MAYAFYRCQAGKEVTRGTAVAATAKWMAFTLRPVLGDREWVRPEEDIATLAPALRAYTVRQLADMGTLSGDATFEDILYPLLISVKGGVTPTQPDPTGAPSVRLWTFSPSLTTANDPDTFTVEWGDDVQAWRSEYVFATGLTISGAMGEALKVSAPLVGRQHNTTTFTAGLANRTVESALMNLTRVYFNDSGGTIGTTQISGAVTDFEFRFADHFVPFFAADGQLFFSKYSEKKLFPELDITLVLDAATKTLMTTKYAAGTIQLVRIRAEGTTIAGAYKKYLQIDGAYLISGMDAIAEADGMSVVTMHLVGLYDSTWGKLFEISAQNSISTLP